MCEPSWPMVSMMMLGLTLMMMAAPFAAARAFELNRPARSEAECERPPGDWHARRHGMEEWLRGVGWRR